MFDHESESLTRTYTHKEGDEDAVSLLHILPVSQGQRDNSAAIRGVVWIHDNEERESRFEFKQISKLVRGRGGND